MSGSSDGSLDPRGLPLLPASAVPWLTVEQMKEVDRLMIDELGITLERMMENAGRSLALLARRLLGGAAGRRIAVLAGTGGNGGGGLVAARHLHVAGADVRVALAAPADRLALVPRAQLDILTRLGLPMGVGADAVPEACDLALDAVLGYSQEGDPSGEAAVLIERSSAFRVLSLDVPSGLELATGLVRSPHTIAEATLTLALPKDGLRAPGAAAATGALYLADISVPPLVYARLGLAFDSPFSTDTVVRLGHA